MALLGPTLATASPAVSINLLRERAVTDPGGLILDVRRQLHDTRASATAARERALLWGLGTAAINNNDDAALAEATGRLGRMGQSGADHVALAAAGFLRARHDLANGIGDGLNQALRAADRMLGQSDTELVAWTRFQLCDAYALGERAERALPLCHQAEKAYRAAGDRYGVGDAENDLGITLASLRRFPEAADMYRQSRRDFIAAKAPELAVMVGENLSSVLLELGQPAQALALSQDALKHELAAGRISDSLGSSTNIAKAEAALGRPQLGYQRMHEAVARARKAGMNGELIDMLVIESRLAERIGKLKPALSDMREAFKLSQSNDTPAMRAREAELAQRYAVREKELHIALLERDNRLASAQLKAARAEAARRIAEQRRLTLRSELSLFWIGGLMALALLLLLLLRAQRRHAAQMREQALVDPLTHIANRRAFMQHAEVLLAVRRAPGSPRPVLLLLDFDHFKRINDTGGHALGDQVLVQVARCLSEDPQRFELVARVGGEEFAVLLLDREGDSGARLAEGLRRGVRAVTPPAELPIRHISVSIGVALFDGERCADLGSWMRAADEALYAAKAAGRDCVVVSGAGLQTSALT